MSNSLFDQLLSILTINSASIKVKPSNTWHNFELLKRVFSYSLAYPVLFTVVYMLLLCTSFLTIYHPGLAEHFVKILSQETDTDQFANILMEKFIIDLILKGLDCAQNYCQCLLARKVERKVQEDFYGSLLDKDIDYFESQKIGELASKLNGDLTNLKSIVVTDMTQIFKTISMFLISLGFMISVSPRIVLLFLTLSVFRVYLIWSNMDYFRECKKVVAGLKADAASVANEAFSNIKTVKSFSTEAKEFKKYTKKLDKHDKMDCEKSRKELIYLIMMYSLEAVIFSLVALKGVNAMLDGEINVYQLSRLVSYSRILSSNFSFIEFNIRKVLASLGNAERIFKELDTRPSIDPKEGEKVLEEGLKEDITFESVNFSYSNKKDIKVLKNINLKIKRGEHIAIAGESGSGKTTFTNLIQRLYDPTEGVIRIGNRNLKEVDLKWLHSKMGLISQDPALFSGSIEENVVYGVDMYSDEDLDKAITKAYMKKFLENKALFPEGLKTQVGERGNKLSGGQRQRVAIARALIKKPDLLIFDEATSALDSESEHQIMKGLEQLLKNREQTMIVIAHRLSTIMHCDKIVVCQNGEIVETGNHQELIEMGGVYKNLVERQYFFSKNGK